MNSTRFLNKNPFYYNRKPYAKYAPIIPRLLYEVIVERKRELTSTMGFINEKIEQGGRGEEGGERKN